MLGCRKQALTYKFFAVVRIERLQQLGEFPCAEIRIYIWNFLFQFVAVTLTQATGHIYALHTTILLGIRKLKDRFDALLLGTFDEAASVDDDHRCGIHWSVVGHIKVIGLELAHEDLGVKCVFGATKGDHMGPAARRSARPHDAAFSGPKDTGNNESTNSMALNT